MAKISFTKLNKIKSLSPVEISIDDQKVLVEQYLPLEDKLNIITNVVFQSGDGEEGFYNIVKLRAFFVIEVLQYYTNINFTEKQLEDTPKLYDAICLNGIWDPIEKAIPAPELNGLWEDLLNIAKEITSYHNSALGIMRQLTQNQEDVGDIITNLYNQIRDPEQLKMVKRLIEQTGPIE